MHKLWYWFTMFAVPLEGEGEMRAQLAEKLPFQVLDELPLFSRAGDVAMTPVRRYGDLLKVVHHYLDMIVPRF